VTTWHLITGEYPPQVGGVSDYCELIAEGLADAGDEVHVWCPYQCAPATGRARVHPELGRIGPGDLRAVDGLLDKFPRPRRLLVQWVPHGFGWHSMNLPFCLWVHRRSRRGDRVELMVHEPFLEFRARPVHHILMATMHRLMTIVLLHAATRVWIAIPAWERLLRPYALGRRIPFAWLPIPSVTRSGELAETSTIRQKYAGAGGLIGHFGSFSRDVSKLLGERVSDVLSKSPFPSLVLVGTGSERFRTDLLEAHPDFCGRVHAIGYVPASQLGAYLSACDLCVQPYPDGISSRRTTAMACLSLGVPVVTTHGHLTEQLWQESKAVSLATVSDPLEFTRQVQQLLGDHQDRRQLAERSRALYESQFSARRIIDALRDSGSYALPAA
jgi:glycosyltransferase involved in cell wall biosynthesis